MINFILKYEFQKIVVLIIIILFLISCPQETYYDLTITILGQGNVTANGENVNNEESISFKEGKEVGRIVGNQSPEIIEEKVKHHLDN